MVERVLCLTTKVTICEETRYLARLRAELMARGHQVLCFLPEDGGSAAELLGGRPWWGLGRRLGALLFRDEWVRAAAAFQPTVIHACGSGVLRPADLLASALAVPLVVTLFEVPGRSIVLQLRRRPPAALVVTYEEAAEAVEDRLPSYRGRCRVMVPGVAVGSSASSIAGQRARPEATERPLVVGTVSELGRQDGVELLLRAWGRLGGYAEGCELVIMGEGPEEGRLRRLARRLGIRDHTNFLSPPADPILALAAVDVAVVLSRRRLRVLSILEAQAAGAAVVTSAIPGAERFVQDGVTGRLLREPTAEALAVVLRELLLDEELRRSLGEEARERVSRAAPLEQMVTATEALYDDVTASAGSMST